MSCAEAPLTTDGPYNFCAYLMSNAVMSSVDGTPVDGLARYTVTVRVESLGANAITGIAPANAAARIRVADKTCNLRDLLDCKANIDFAYKLFLEQGGFTPWSTFRSGAYRQFLKP